MNGGACPYCGWPIPIVKAQLGRGRPFTCAKCEKSILVPKVPMRVGVPVIVAFLILAKQVSWVSVALLLIAGALIETLLVRVRGADQDGA